MPDDFQDLPESKYPRSYTPRMRAQLMRLGGERPVSSVDTQQEQDRAMSRGEQGAAVIGKRVADIRSGKAQPSELKDIAGSFRRGGKVKKTGVYRLHKGERVVPARIGKTGTKSKSMSKG